MLTMLMSLKIVLKRACLHPIIVKASSLVPQPNLRICSANQACMRAYSVTFQFMNCNAITALKL